MSDDDSNSAEGQNRTKARKKQCRLLIVDDEVDITAALKKGLTQMGFEVTVYNDPLRAAYDFKQGQYDIAILDIKMPQINGFQLYRKLRSIDLKIRVCFLTAYEIYQDEFRKVLPTISVSCFAKKPITIEQLANIIIEELGGGRQEIKRT
jgi:two-component system, OmpR family, response regulator ChvI